MLCHVKETLDTKKEKRSRANIGKTINEDTQAMTPSPGNERRRDQEKTLAKIKF